MVCTPSRAKEKPRRLKPPKPALLMPSVTALFCVPDVNDAGRPSIEISAREAGRAGGPLALDPDVESLIRQEARAIGRRDAHAGGQGKRGGGEQRHRNEESKSSGHGRFSGTRAGL
jgi:hypothetical protein